MPFEIIIKTFTSFRPYLETNFVLVFFQNGSNSDFTHVQKMRTEGFIDSLPKVHVHTVLSFTGVSLVDPRQTITSLGIYKVDGGRS